MFHHIVLMRFSPAADAAFIARAQGYCARIRAEADGVVDYFMAENTADRRGPFQYTIVGVFLDAAAHDRYQISPLHQEMKTYMGQFIEQILVSDTET